MTREKLEKALDELRDEMAIEQCGGDSIYEDLFKEGFDANKEILLELVEALESIACISKEKQDTQEYWMTVSHDECATVLATDTSIARKTLSKLYAHLEGE
jgi:hypothetical protein